MLTVQASNRLLREAHAEIKQIAPSRLLIAALDIGKDINVPHIVTGVGETLLAPRKLSTLASGYQFFVGKLDQFIATDDYDLVLLGHEPTGIYHQPWSMNLVQHYRANMLGEVEPLMRYRLLTPNLVKKERERTTHRRRKSDIIDVYAMTNLLAEGIGNPYPVLDSASYQLRMALTQMYRFSKRLRALGGDILAQLDLLWPGCLGNEKKFTKTHPELDPLLHLIKSRPLERITLRVLIQHCPNPYDIIRLQAGGVRDLFHNNGARCGVKTAQKIVNVAKQSQLLPEAYTKSLADQLHNTFKIYLQLEEAVHEYEKQAVALLPQTPGAVLMSFPGASDLMAARYLAGIQDYNRFKSYKEVWSYAGFDPNRAGSGNVERIGKMSKRGSAYLRNTLYQLGHLAAIHCPDCVRLYDQLCKRGISNTSATIHIANKVNRIFFSMLKKQEAYKSPLSAKDEEKWLEVSKNRRKRK